METFIDDIEVAITQVYSANKPLFSNQDETLEKTFQLYQETISENVSEEARLRLFFVVGGAYTILKNNQYTLNKDQKDTLYANICRLKKNVQWTLIHEPRNAKAS